MQNYKNILTAKDYGQLLEFFAKMPVKQFALWVNDIIKYLQMAYKRAGDSIWWVFVTITTVGYGDFYPVTLEGRLIAVLLMTTGVGLFGTFTAYVANWLLRE